MARFDVYANPEEELRDAVPYWLDVQNTYLAIETRVVVPLHSPNHFQGMISDLSPTLLVHDNALVMNTCAIGVVPGYELRRAVANLSSQQAAIQNALDTLLGGY
ncbi:MAG: CcdB family protein [Rhodoferax sp.]|nr:CcdB family protein [Rhodoferax sp.]